MEREKMLELAARCEAAEGPDRELNAQIGRVFASDFLGYIPDDAMAGCAHFTASIDAALTLAKDVGVLITLSEIKGDGMPHCVIGNPETAELFEAVAATPALALTAAALRARASQEQSHAPK